MSSRVAVAVVHGVGRTAADFADRTMDALEARCREACGGGVVFGAVHWGPVLQAAEDALWGRVNRGGLLHYPDLRRLAIDFLADAIAYQITPTIAMPTTPSIRFSPVRCGRWRTGPGQQRHCASSPTAWGPSSPATTFMTCKRNRRGRSCPLPCALSWAIRRSNAAKH